MSRIMQIIALATGVSISDLSLLLSSADAQTIEQLKMLKVKLSGYNTKVFESEFGRNTPLVMIREVRKPGNLPPQIIDKGKFDSIREGIQNLKSCSVHFGKNSAKVCADMWGSCSDLEVCGVVIGTCPGLKECTSINETECPEVGDQCFGNFSRPSCPGENAKINTIYDLLNKFKSDPYVQDLMTHFNVTSTQALARQIETMLKQKKVYMPLQHKKQGVTQPLFKKRP